MHGNGIQYYEGTRILYKGRWKDGQMERWKNVKFNVKYEKNENTDEEFFVSIIT